MTTKTLQRITFAWLALLTATGHASPAYFAKYSSLSMARDADGVLTVTMTNAGKPIRFNAHDHETFVDAFYDISRDRDNKVVILTGDGGEWMGDIDFASFGDVSDPDVWAKVHDEGTQVLENLANVRVPFICAVEGKAWVHTEYCLLADMIVAAEGATFNDLPHFNGGIIPGDGVYTLWSYHVGPARAHALLLNPKPITARQAEAWGLVAEVTKKGGALSRAHQLAAGYLSKPELTRRFTRVHFIQPIKRRLVEEVGYGLALEGQSAAALVKRMKHTPH
jgi:enoyl-CoA hydratase/carnithine racemase